MSSRKEAPQTFLDVYNSAIAPKLREIDIFLKEKEIPVTIWQTSQLLDMPYEEVKEIIHKLNINSLDRKSLFTLIMTGTSSICRLIQRETERGFPIYYTPEDIAFIYNIDSGLVEDVFHNLGMVSVKESCLPLIFDSLPPCEN